MTTQPSRKPWHEVVQLRDDLKTGAPAPEAVEEINELLSQVSDELKLA